MTVIFRSGNFVQPGDRFPLAAGITVQVALCHHQALVTKEFFDCYQVNSQRNQLGSKMVTCLMKWESFKPRPSQTLIPNWVEADERFSGVPVDEHVIIIGFSSILELI
jgi:hypothetical protein